jgi:hypothetical protein
MSPRAGLIAQIIGVIALGSVVYLALLTPEEPDPLTAIEVENGAHLAPPKSAREGRAARPGQAGATRRHEKHRNRNDKPRLARRHGMTRLPRLVAAQPPPSEPTVTDRLDTPSGSQYADSVARILGQVAGAAP